jgi:tRNA pseudouridine32 synthase/23S rRNA pseudouridine746 synthase/23S rRNA pseudouridine1911/1915/1917 synthase
MPEHRQDKQFKRPPRKYQPKGLNILFEDRDIIFVDKVTGLLTMGTDRESIRTAYSNLTDYVSKGNHKSPHRIFIVHRLDRETSGVLVFAKTEEVKTYLQSEWSNFNKTYYAVVHGHLPENEGIISSYLVEQGVFKMYSATNPDQKKQGKLSKTAYKVLKQNDTHSLVELNILTGRKHQIRVHLADKGCPVVGDKKYGNDGKGEKGVKRLALHAAKLSIKHPYSKDDLVIEAPMPDYFESMVK